MNIVKIPAEKTTPEVELNPNGSLSIKGRSIHENIRDFFNPIEEWVVDYVSNDPAEVTTIDINLEYFNSATAKALLNILQKLIRVQLKSRKLVVNWHYEKGDEDIQERGEYFASVLKIPFNFKEFR
ncbi:MAG: DUF1987 domain-containing protein [Bacteroidales bacterium]|jgi:hypothetical protein|nr:DUF1987 domain-containing protein [Bacteroidales bacterium]